ncbi:Hsp70 family protein [Streptomyces spectabilis]|uniref:Hsp70 family protein n=1 Tax=Streptomyces spectabilis TaxID=68270 RepID=A0A516RIP0_STRST|nr:hypothetical protein [Streptomyces spectabilis]QDQ15519.1 hypothetical protein FH965_37245 [Streptomyces spectabilis]
MTAEERTADDGSLVIGFDLGHGESAVATLWSSADGEPHVEDVSRTPSRVHPTVVALCRTEGEGTGATTLVGEQCFAVVSAQIARVPEDPPDGLVPGDTEFYMAFKHAGLDARTRRATELFIRQIARELAMERTEGVETSGILEVMPGTRLYWVFGIPSGWDKGEYEEYVRLLRSTVTGLFPGQRVELIPESRAAMLYAKESEEFKNAEQELMGAVAGRGTVLVMDMGSLTTDYTFVSGTSELPVSDWNSRFGASLIEKELLRRVVADHRDSALLEEALAHDPLQRARLEFACRRAKERYFGLSPDELRLNPGPRRLGGDDVVTRSGELIEVSLRLSPSLMDDILDARLDELGRSWRTAFREAVEGVRDKLVKETGKPPDIVLMTGGASRMRFAQEICLDAFEAGQSGTRVLLGVRPEHAIAKGLAIAGRTRLRVEAFLEEVAKLVDERVPAIIGDNLEALGLALGEVTVDGIVDAQVCPAVVRWREGELRLLTDIAVEVAKKREAYLKSPAGQAKLKDVTRAWYADVTAVIDREAAAIAHRYGIPTGPLRVSPFGPTATTPRADVNLEPLLETLDTILGLVAAWMTSMTAGAAIGVITAASQSAAGAGAVAAASNPLGWIIGSIVAAVAVVIGIWMGKDALMKWISNADIAGPVRKLNREKTLLRKIRTQAEEDGLEEKAAADFAQQFADSHRETIVSRLSTTVGAQLTDAAREAALLIDRRSDPE